MDNTDLEFFKKSSELSIKIGLLFDEYVNNNNRSDSYALITNSIASSTACFIHAAIKDDKFNIKIEIANRIHDMVLDNLNKIENNRSKND
jgi:hypothetical protein